MVVRDATCWGFFSYEKNPWCLIKTDTSWTPVCVCVLLKLLQLHTEWNQWDENPWRWRCSQFNGSGWRGEELEDEEWGVKTELPELTVETVGRIDLNAPVAFCLITHLNRRRQWRPVVTQRHSNSAACSRCRAAAHRLKLWHTIWFFLVVVGFCFYLEGFYLNFLDCFCDTFWRHTFLFLLCVSFCIHANLLSCLSLWVGVCCSGRASAPWTRWRTSKGASPFPFLALRPLRRTNSRSR